MAEKSKKEIGINESAIDNDSSEDVDIDNKTEIFNSHSTKRRNNQFSVNIFFYSYPFPFRYIKKTILSSWKNQKA
jgi:hypothetical protein